MAVHVAQEIPRKRLIAHRLFLFCFLLVIAMVLSPRPVFAAGQKQVIEFPDEELASESVLPVFDHPEAVKNRLVPTAKRLELGVFGTYSMTEAFFNPLAVGIDATYHINETHGVNLMAQYYMSGVSNYTNQLNNSPGTATANLQLAPAPKYLLLANYQYTAFYGKISLTKDYVMNLSLYGLGGLGAIAIGDSTNPVGSIGIGQKFYFGNSLALRFDLRGLMYNGPDVTSISLTSKTSEVSASAFDQKIQFGTLLSAGLVYLFPSF